MSMLTDNVPLLVPGPRSTLEDQMNQAYLNDPLATEIFEALHTGVQRHRILSLVDCRNNNGRLYY